jgi:hypothetical protein
MVEEAYPLTSQAAQMVPAVGIPWAGLKYARAVDDGDTEEAIKASLAAIPVAERTYKLGTQLANGRHIDRALTQSRGLWDALQNLGRRFGAGEQVAETVNASAAHAAQRK